MGVVLLGLLLLVWSADADRSRLPYHAFFAADSPTPLTVDHYMALSGAADGSDGTAGATGPTGPTGPTGVTGTFTLTAYFKATISSTQSIGSNTTTKINFDTESWDIGNKYDTTNKRWTPPAGYVHLYCQIEPSAVDQFAEAVYIYKNGAAAARFTGRYASNSNASLAVNYDDLANGTDYYECYVNVFNLSFNLTADYANTFVGLWYAAS